MPGERKVDPSVAAAPFIAAKGSADVQVRVDASSNRNDRSASIRCNARRPVVRAITYDGEKVDQIDLARWVPATPRDPFLAALPSTDGRVVVREHLEEATRESVVRRGDVGIETPTSSFGRDTLAAEQCWGIRCQLDLAVPDRSTSSSVGDG